MLGGLESVGVAPAGFIALAVSFGSEHAQRACAVKHGCWEGRVG